MLSPNLRYHAPAHGDGGLSFFVEMGVTGERLRKLIPVVDAFDVQLRSVLGGLLGPGTFQFKYQVGYMYTEYTWAQRAHIDFPYRQLALYPHQLFIGFFPLTSEGTFLQVWTSDFVGHLVFIPYGCFWLCPLPRSMVVDSVAVHLATRVVICTSMWALLVAFSIIPTRTPPIPSHHEI
jgi:hypothetical protein